jgi:hypothetical protein|tara:strand:+ start:668 stop:988 length:321 start_codon:yes stop_codon:yes gene_type:complete
MADQKISELTASTNLTSEDLLHLVNDPNGTPTNQKIDVKKVFGKVPANTMINGTFEANTTSIRVSTSSTPSNSTAAGVHGNIKWDTSYIYVCTANNVWKRVTLASF